MRSVGGIERRGAFAIAALVVLAIAAHGGQALAAPPQLWDRCAGGVDDIGCPSLLRGVAAAPRTAAQAGDVLVADQGGHRVVEFTAWGDFVRAWGRDVVASGPGDKGEEAFEICVRADGDACRLGKGGEGAGEMMFPQGIAVDSAGNVYVVDFLNQRIQKFDPEGNFLRMWGKEVNSGSSGNANLCTDAGPPTDVCDAGAQGLGNGEFGAWAPISTFIAVDLRSSATEADDRVYVGDVGRIQQFNTNGEWQAQIATPGISPGEKIKSLAVDRAGSIYAAIEGKANVRKWNAAHTYLGETVKVEKPQALAADPADVANRLYLLDGAPAAVVRKYNAAGAQLEEFGQEEPPTPKLGSAIGIAAGSACLSAGNNVYVSNPNPAFLRAYGPVPDRLEDCPLAPKEPVIASQFPLSAGAVDAFVQAEINPRFWGDATYFVQYGASACIEAGGWEAECASRTATRELGATRGEPVRTAAVLLEGLDPGVSHSFRFVAESGGGGPVEGAEARLTTHSGSGSPTDSCPNALLRAGPDARLADCRAYEMVSPVDKDGGDILSFVTSIGRPTAHYQSAPDGERITYSSHQAFAGSESQPYTAQYIAGRGGGGWSSEAINPPRATAVGSSGLQSENEFKAFSADLCEGWLVNVNQAIPPLLTPGTVEGGFNFYRRSNCDGGSYAALGAGEIGTGTQLEVQGISADGQALFRTREHLSQEVATSAGTALRCRSARAAETVSFQWLRDGEPIAGKTASTYTPSAGEDAGMTVQCRVRVANAGAGAVQATNPTWVIAPYPAVEPPAAPFEVPAPSASGPLAVGGPGGQALTCDPGAWRGADSFSYRWYRNGTEVAGATGQTYETSAEDLEAAAAFQCEAIGENAGGRVAKASENLLTNPAPADPPAPRAGAIGGRQDNFITGLRVYQTLPGGGLRAVCVLAGTRTEASVCSAGSSPGLETSPDGNSASVKGAISADGSRVFWSDRNLGTGQIFARIDGTETIPVSDAEAQFWAASPEGSAVLFTEGADLYRFDIDAALAEEAGAKEAIAGQVKGVLGASEDLSRIYLVSGELLSGADENSEEDKAEAGANNLYLYEGGGFEFVGRLSSADAQAKTEGHRVPTTPLNVQPILHSARVTPDGGAAAFTSSARLTGYDNTDAASGKADAEVFRYVAGADRLDCVSCNPSGARPRGRNLGAETLGGEIDSTFWAAARIPGWTTQLYASRLLSEDGSRLYFQSFEPLVLADTNGKEDVYQWEALGKGSCSASSPDLSPAAGGCVSLISSGKSPNDSEFLDASASGSDVFFRTGSSLVGIDPGQIDVYDARVGGGFPEPAPAPPCEGAACQNPPGAPEIPSPASSAFRGPGNLPSREGCPKGKRRVRRGGKSHCVKRHGRRSHRKTRRARG